ncbi:MAG: DinB family protein [Pseudomonadota bacterium]
MITPAYARTMMRYNRWQNHACVAAAGDLSDAERWQDRGAFFGSIAETLNHILWDDRVWLARLHADHATAAEIAARHPYTESPRAWEAFTQARTKLDDDLVAWADSLSTTDLACAVTWDRGGTRVETTFAFNFVHMVNHQTHHRGQVHAMLTAAGIDPGPTDLQMLPVLGDLPPEQS